MSSSDFSPSNAGRCDICGEPIDMEHADERAVVWSGFGNIDHPEVTEEDVVNGIADVLEQRTVEDRMAAIVLRDKAELVAHRRCWDETSIDDLWPDSGQDLAEGDEVRTDE